MVLVMKDAFFVLAEGQPLEEPALPLPLEFFYALFFIERAREVVGYAQQLGIMRPAQCARQCLAFWVLDV